MTDREIYLAATGLASDCAPPDANARSQEAVPTDLKRDARCAALERSHEIRQFEIELYWKRANYFWLLQAAVFAAVGLTWKNTSSGVPAAVPVMLSALGVITAFAGYLSALGSKFWQENWEHHIDMLEDEFEGRLHKTAFVGSKGIQWSVSGINERLSLCFVAFWFAVLVGASHAANPGWNLKPAHLSLASPSLTECATVASWLLALAGAFLLYARPSKLTGEKQAYSDHAAHKRVQRGWPRLWASSGTRPYLVRREPHL